MKNKILKIILVIVLLICYMPLASIKIESREIGSGVKNKLNFLRNKFPNNAYWNHVVQKGHGYSYGTDHYGPCNNPDGYTWVPCDTHNGNVGIGGHDCNSFSASIQCRGFGKKIFYDLFGHYTDQLSARYDRDIKPGDYVSFNHINHAAVVVSVSGNSFTVIEANAGGKCRIAWEKNTYYKGNIEFYKRAPNYINVDEENAPKPDASNVMPNVNIDQSNGSTLISWSSVPNAQFYCVRIDDSFGNSVFYKEVSNTNVTTQLPLKGTYYVYISANNDNGFTLSKTQYVHYLGIPSDIGNNRTVKIKASASGKYLYYDNVNNRILKKDYSEKDASKYLFRLLKQTDKSYVIQSEYDSGKVLDVYNNINTNGNTVSLYTNKGSDNQKFWITPSGHGGYAINKIGTPFVMDTGGESLYIYEHTSNNNSYQNFTFEDINMNPQSIKLNPDKATLSIGTGFQAKVLTSPSYSNSKVTWSSSTPAVASVDNNGNIKALRAGSTYITAKTSNGKTARCLVKVVEIKPTRLSLNTTSATLSIGNSFQAKATIYPSNASNKVVTWKSSTPAVASVDREGKVTALRAGSTYIVAKSSNGIEKKILLSVVSVPVKKVGMNLANANLAIGDSFTAKANIYPTNASNKSIKYSTSNSKVVTVDASGKVIAVGQGRAYVNAVSSNGKVGKILVSVFPNPNSINITPTSATVKQGTTFQARSFVKPTNAIKRVTYYTTNENVAKVNSSGVVIAVNPGKTYLCAKTHNGLIVKKLITVVSSKQENVNLNNGVYTLMSPDGNYALDVIGGSEQLYTRTQVYPVNNTQAQNFVAVNRGNNVFTFSPSYAQHLVLDVYHPNGGIKEGDKVDIYQYDEPIAQEWTLTKLPNGNFLVRLKSNPSLVLTRGGYSDAQGNAIYVGDYTESFTQAQWKIVPK